MKAGQLNIDAGKNLILATAAQDRNSTFAGGGASGTRVQTDLGRIASIDVSGNATIKTANNFEQTGAQLKVGGDLNADIGGSYILGSVKRTDSLDAGFALNGASGTSSSKLIQNTLSGVQVGGATLIKTGRDFTSQGAGLDLQGGGQIQAQGNINLLAVKDALSVSAQSTSNSRGGSASTTRQSLDETLRGSNLTSNSGLTLTSGKDITIAASQIQAQGATRLSAAGNVSITTEQEQHSSTATHNGSSSGFLSSKSSTEQNTNDTSLAAGSSIGGGTVVVSAGQDINVKGSSVIADTGTTLVASRDINITAGENTRQQTSFAEKNESGFLSGGGLGVTYGNRQQSTDIKSQQTTAAASTVGSVAGNVNLIAGNAYKQVGSDVLAPGGDINIIARKVDIIEARQTSGTDTETKFKQSGVTLQITSPVLSALQTVNQMSQAAANTSDGRMKALAGANMAFAANNAANTIQAGQGSTLGGKEGQIATFDDKGNPTGSRDASAADQAGGINLALSIGSSSSQSTSKSRSDTARGSSLTAGGNIAIIASGGGQDSNLTIQGSTVEAGQSAFLLADNQIKLVAATNQASQQSSNTSSAGSIGISYGTDGLLLNLSASKGRGKADGKDTSYTNTQIKGGNGPGDTGNSVTLQSGGDTILQGAVIAANQVRADVGGNLSIESLQDSSTYTGRQQNFGGSLSIGYGNMSGSISASKSNVDSSYQSVSQQSGIKAGDGGFEVNVKGNTDLKGAVIASTDKAVNEARNTFTTGGTLTASDIQNSASYKGESTGISAGTGVTAKTAGINGVGVGLGSDKGSAASTTTAGISGIAGNTAVRSTDAETGLRPIFDADKVQKDINAQVAITQAFGREAPKAVASYAETQYNALKGSDPAEAAQWAEGGAYRIALHTAAGALGGGLSGAAGAAASASAANLMNDLQDGLQQSLQGQGLSAGAAKAIAQTVAGLTAAGLGAAMGGSYGAAAGLAVDANNRQLHPTEIQWIKGNAKRYAAQNGISEAVAETRLAQQAFREVQFGADGQTDASAQAFLKGAGNQLLPGDPALPGQTVGYMFKADPVQRANTNMYASAVVANPDALMFYAANGITQPNAAQIQAVAMADQRSRDYLSNATKAAAGVASLAALAGASPTVLTWVLSNPEKAVQTGLISVETAAAIASGATVPTVIPARGSLSNEQARTWYLQSEAKISQMVDSTAPLEVQAYQQWNLRNYFRTEARNSMSDRELAAALTVERPNQTWVDVVGKYSREYSGEELWLQVIAASQRSNAAVNQSLGVKPPLP